MAPRLLLLALSLQLLFSLRKKGFIQLQFVTLGCRKMMQENSRDCQGLVEFENICIQHSRHSGLQEQFLDVMASGEKK